MGNTQIIKKLIAIGLTTILVSPSVHAIDYLNGDLRVSGFVRAQTAISTTNDKNAANTALGQQDNPDYNLNRIWGITDFDYRPSSLRNGLFDSVRLFARVKLAYDLTEDLSGGVDKYDAFAASNNLKDRGTMMNISNNTASADIWELFVDIKKGKLWTRLGRQNIVWGESDGVRLLDIVNPLDNAWHPFEGGGELFDHRRIPLWMARFTYDLPFKDLSIDFFYNPGDFVPTVQAEAGSPWNVNPLPRDGIGDPADGFLVVGSPFGPTLMPGTTFIVDDDTNDWRGEDQWGIRLLGSIGGFNYTLNYLSLIDQDGVISATNTLPIFTPTPPTPPGGPVAVLPVLENTHERLDIAGASFNWYADSLATVFRGEMSYTFDKPFAKSASNLQFAGTIPLNPQDALGVADRDEMKVMLGIDRPTFVFSKTRTMNISAQVIYTEREKITLDTDLNGLAARKDETQLTLNLSQPFNNDQFFVEFFGLYDIDGGYWLQPQVRWQPGNNWRVWAYYNAFGGEEERSIAVYDHADEMNIAVSYQF